MLPSSVHPLRTPWPVSAPSAKHFPVRPVPRSASPRHCTNWVASRKPTPSRRAVGTHPVDLSLARLFATIAAERGDWAEAIRRWTQVTAVFSDYLPGYWHRADALAKAERWAEADAVLGDAVARFPEDLETALRWARSGRRGC